MVKNVKPSKSTSHLSLRNTSAATVPVNRFYESLNELHTQRMQQLPGQLTPAASSSSPEAALSPVERIMTQPDDGNSRSLFEGFNDREFLRSEQFGRYGPMNDHEKSLYQSYTDQLALKKKELKLEIQKEKAFRSFGLKSPEKYTQPFCDFLTEYPTVFHVVHYCEKKLGLAGYEKACVPYLLCILLWFLGL